MAITSRKQTILWLMVFAVAYAGCVWSIVSVLQPIPRYQLKTLAHGILGFSPNSQFFATSATRTPPTSSPDSKFIPPIEVWRVSNGKREFILELNEKSKGSDSQLGSIHAVNWSPDSNRIAIITDEGWRVQVYEVPGRMIFEAFEGNLGVEYGFSKDSRHLIAKRQDDDQVFDLESKERDHRLQLGRRILFSNCYSIDPGKAPCILESKSSLPHAISECGSWLIRRAELHPLTHKIDLQLRDLRTGLGTETALVGELINSDSGPAIQILNGDLSIRFALPIELCTRIANDSGFRFDFSHVILDRTFGISITHTGRNSKLLRRWDCSKSPHQCTIEFEAHAVAINHVGDRVWSLEQPDFVPELVFRDFSSNVTVPLARIPSKATNASLITILTDSRGSLGACYWRSFEPQSSLGGLVQNFSGILSRWLGNNFQLDLFGFGLPRIELWDGPAAMRLSVIHAQHAVGFAPDGNTFVTQDENYNIFFWDIPPRRNWPLAAGLAIVPAMIATGILLIIVSFGRRIYRRFRPAAASH